MIYALLGIGVLGTIFFLLWRVETQKRKKTEIEKGLSDARVIAFSEIVKLERKLREVSKEDAENLRKEIQDIERRVLDAKPGEVVSDIFGSVKPTQEG